MPTHFGSRASIGTNNVSRRLKWIVGVIWSLSWLELYLEIYRHHHLAPAFLGIMPAPEIRAGSHPGVWLLTILVTSALAPPLFGIVTVWLRWHQPEGAKAAGAFDDAGLAWGLIVIGAVLAVFGGINQSVQRTPLEVDWTLRRGNGGFGIEGLVLVFAGGLMRRVRSQTQETM